jgi:hypothetical protein
MWRLGAYGDPAAVPLEVWTEALKRFKASGHTGYTHQWKSERLEDTLALCQASLDGPGLANSHKVQGGYFRVTSEPDKLLPGEILCPSYTHGTTCADCGLCNATGHKVVIPVHGAGAGKFVEVT